MCTRITGINCTPEATFEKCTESEYFVPCCFLYLTNFHWLKAIWFSFSCCCSATVLRAVFAILLLSFFNNVKIAGPTCNILVTNRSLFPCFVFEYDCMCFVFEHIVKRSQTMFIKIFFCQKLYLSFCQWSLFSYLIYFSENWNIWNGKQTKTTKSSWKPLLIKNWEIKTI